MIFLLTAPQFYRGAAAGEYRRMGKNTARLWARAKIKSLSEETGSCLMEKSVEESTGKGPSLVCVPGCWLLVPAPELRTKCSDVSLTPKSLLRVRWLLPQNASIEAHSPPFALHGG